MIRYSLNCAAGHTFDSWFRDSAAYEALETARQLSCAICGTNDVRRAIMAPAVRGERAQDMRGPHAGEPAAHGDRAAEQVPSLSAPAHPAEQALARLRRHIEQNSDYVGRDFAAEARRIHDGEADARAIWGEARVDEAKALHDDGIPVAPLPWMTRRND